MPSYDNRDHTSNSSFLSASSPSPRKSPIKQSLSLNGRRSSASLRGNNLAQAIDEDVAGRHSLAHELAAALMPEPSAGSKLLAEEFGIEFDDGAEGIDEVPEANIIITQNDISFDEELDPSAAAALLDDTSVGGASSLALELQDEATTTTPAAAALDLSFELPTPTPKQRPQREQDPMIILSQDLESTEKFLSSLQRLDAESGPHSSSQPTLEQLASNIISRINETARDREQQVRELLAYEREFRKIAGEVGGEDVLCQLDELERVDGLGGGGGEDVPTSPTITHKRMSSVPEEPLHPRISRHWDNDEIEYDSDQQTPVKDTFPPPPPPLIEPLTPAKTIPQLAHFRTLTTSLVSSLTSISEQVQVNGAATTEAGRKIRALKNKLGGWRTDWDSAERSRLRIEKWEAGMGDIDASPSGSMPSTPRSGSRRIDGRTIAEEHLRASQQALVDATHKTLAIMAAV